METQTAVFLVFDFGPSPMAFHLVQVQMGSTVDCAGETHQDGSQLPSFRLKRAARSNLLHDDMPASAVGPSRLSVTVTCVDSSYTYSGPILYVFEDINLA